MKKKFTAIAIILCMGFTSLAFARGNGHGHHGGYHKNYHNRSYYYGHRGGYNNYGLGIAAGVVGGLLLGSALLYPAAPPPPAVVYGAPYPPYPAEVVVRQPRICVQDRVVTGQWQINAYNGRRIWVPYAYPVTERVQVPCY